MLAKNLKVLFLIVIRLKYVIILQFFLGVGIKAI